MSVIEYSDQKSILTLEKVTKTFSHNSKGNNHVVLDGISLDIREGEFVTIVGPSGCGKSTLLNIVAGLENADSGIVSLRGDSKASRIVIFQESAVFPWLTVQDNIEFGLRVGGVSKKERRKIADHFVEMVHMEKFSDSYIYQLSGGMKQRVAIARALALNPQILLMDEPFAALDVQTKEELYNQLLQIHHETKKTILFVTHNIDEAILLGNRVVILSPILHGIKKEFAIDIRGSRSMSSPEVQIIKRQVLKELEEDFRFARRE